MMEREYIVTAKTKEDLESLYEDLETLGGCKCIPDREIECAHRRPISRNTHYYLTDEEAELIRKDSRVLSVELTPEELGIVFQPLYTVQTFDDSINTIETPLYTETSNRWSKTTNVSNSFRNWGLLRCVAGNTFTNWGSDGTTNPSDGNVNYTARVTASGKNVDVVIVDGCIDPAHPEFAVNSSGTGGSRVIQYNWLQHRQEVEGTSNGTYVYTPYIDGNSVRTVDNNHGCHVAGIVAGNTQGWARDANIYNINLYSTAPTVISSSFLFDYIRAWHNSKPINPATGKKNPTITNNSWGSYYLIPATNITSITYRGNTIPQPGGGWTQSTLETYGIMGYFIDTANANTPTVRIPANTSALQADVDDCINDGIIFVAAAGNDFYKSTVSGDVDYDNYITTGSNIYYHRGGQPNGLSGVISVGNVSSLVNESKYVSSTCGSKVDIYAPGDRIMSSIHNGTILNSNGTFGNVTNNTDARSSFYRVAKYTGTSMASPQVAGSLACLSEIWPRMSPAEALDWVRNYGRTLNQMSDDTASDADYTNQSALQGSPNKYLYHPNPRLVPNPAGSSNYYGGTTTSQITLPRGKHKQRTISGNVYPRVDVWHRG